MGEVQICCSGWHFFDDILEQIEESELDIHIVAHQDHEWLKKEKIKSTVIDNVGLEYGSYNYYLNNIWDKESDVIFMHDDIKIQHFDKFIAKNYSKFKKRRIDHGSVTPARIVRPGAQFCYLSKRVVDAIQKDYGGIWFDEENVGYTDWKSQPSHWHIRRVQEGGVRFRTMIEDIGKEYNFLVFTDVIDSDVTFYSRGKDEIKARYTKKELRERKAAIRYQKKRRKKWKEEHDEQ
jgi:hypothetical protein